VDPRTIGLMGAIVGTAVGIFGGILGTFFGIMNTAGPRERAFAIRAAAQCWVAVALFLAALWWTPAPYQALLWVPYVLLLPLTIRAWNRRQEQIRREEASEAGSD
jgi:hypothetical protein